MPQFCFGRVVTPKWARGKAFSEHLDPGVGGTGTCDGTSFTLAEGLAAPDKTLDLTLVEFNPE